MRFFDASNATPARRSLPAVIGFVGVIGFGATAALAQDTDTADAGQPGTTAETRATGEAGSFPIPDIATDAWALDLDADLPRPIAIDDGYGNPRWFWYLPYTVTNNSGQDRLFIPEVTVVTDGGHIIEAGRGVPARVYPAVAANLRNALLESPQEIIGNLRQTEDFARSSVAIWPMPPEDVDQFTVFFAGLSGESAKLRRPSTGEPLLEPALDPETGEPMVDADGNPVMREVIARRTTALTYATPGTPANPQNQSVSLLDEGQVMR